MKKLLSLLLALLLCCSVLAEGKTAELSDEELKAKSRELLQELVRRNLVGEKKVQEFLDALKGEADVVNEEGAIALNYKQLENNPKSYEGKIFSIRAKVVADIGGLTARARRLILSEEGDDRFFGEHIIALFPEPLGFELMENDIVEFTAVYDGHAEFFGKDMAFFTHVKGTKLNYELTEGEKLPDEEGEYPALNYSKYYRHAGDNVGKTYTLEGEIYNVLENGGQTQLTLFSKSGDSYHGPALRLLVPADSKLENGKVISAKVVAKPIVEDNGKFYAQFELAEGQSVEILK